MPDPAAYPLAWPADWPRTKRRAAGPYRTDLAAALKNLRAEIARLCGAAAAETMILSSNCTLGRDKPDDPGVVAYFHWEGEQFAIPCDRWLTVQQNIQAIALTIEAMRAMERHGAKHMIKAMFRGFTALPAPTGQDWRAILGNPATLDKAEAAYRAAMTTAHPDKGGTHTQAATLNAAIAEARRSFSA